jgi:hypothetical protein
MTAHDDDVEREVERLLSAGEHAAAAAALRKAGQPLRAGKVFEQIFELPAALSAYEAGGDVVAAVRVALALRDDGTLDRLVGEAIARGVGDALLGAMKKAGRHREVGRVWRARGDLQAASAALVEANAHNEAAACCEELGDMRAAGLLYERWLEEHPDDVGAAVRLGRIVARFGRHDDAVTILQRAVRTATSGNDRDAVVVQAAPTLALAFVALGYDDAAAAIVARWQQAHARLVKNASDDVQREHLRADPPPTSLDALLSSTRAAAFAAVQTSTPPSPAPGSSPPSSASTADPFDALLGEAAPATTTSTTTTTTTTTAAAPRVDDARAEERLLLNGRYLLGAPLGGGGVGQVFRAFDAFFDRPVAVKIFGAQVLASEAVQAWAREVRAAAALGHPAFVRLVELNLAQGFVVSELHGEGDGAVLLEERLQRGGPGAWLLPTLQQVLDALAAAHRTGLVHGGLKPHNVFVVAGGVKLLDTGAHRLLALRATETGGLASVWPYLSPELLLGAPADVDGDLYALAAIAYRALTGRPPFAGPTADRNVAPAAAGVVEPTVPDAWSAFFARALAPDRSARFSSAEEMRAALPGPVTRALPRAGRVDGAIAGSSQSSSLSSGNDRYVKQGLVDRRGPSEHPVKVFAGRDAVVGRAVFVLSAERPSLGLLSPYVAAAQLWRGVQPVFDVIFDEAGDVAAVVVAGDEHHGRRDGRAELAALRAVPQGLARDLCAVADAITALHDAGVAVGGFDVDRARGPVGPRLTLAPAPLLVPATPEAVAADAASFTALVEVAFGVADDPSLDKRGQLLAALHDGRFLERADLVALSAHAEEPWVRFLPHLIERLVAGAPARVVARLVRAVVQGT